MFFSEEELVIAEDLAWKMLDAWNHEYMPDLEKYAHFYYKNHLVLDPWMNEKMQFMSWPDHSSKKTAVIPKEYYGETTFENFVARLFILRPEWAPKITERLQNNIDEDGNFFRLTGDTGELVYFAMAEEQARDEHTNICIGEAFPESKRVYYLLDKLPENLRFIKQNGWKKEIIVQKQDVKKIIKFLYPKGIKWEYNKSVDRCLEDEIRIIGFGD